MHSIYRIIRALVMALHGHRGQKDKAGKPYWHHLVTVALVAYGLTHDPEAAVVGLLHDYKEDVEKERQQSIYAIFGFKTACRVEHLTRVDMLYEHYIDWILRDGDAVVRAVKLADLLHNTEPGRMKLQRDNFNDVLRAMKYSKAIERLIAKRLLEGQF